MKATLAMLLGALIGLTVIASSLGVLIPEETRERWIAEHAPVEPPPETSPGS